jgi:predicted permease
MLASIRLFLWRLINLFRHDRWDRSLNNELEFHLEMEIAEYQKQGLSSVEARRRAIIALGGLDQTIEMYRETETIPWIEAITRDLRFAGRIFRRNPGFYAAALLTLTMCIGANTAIFSMLYALVIEPLPYPDSDRIVEIYNLIPKVSAIKMGSGDAQYLDFKANAPAFAHLAMWQHIQFTVGMGSESVRLKGMATTSEIFDVLGLQPLLGRFFTSEDIQHADSRVIVLTQSFWESNFQKDPNVLERNVTVDGETRRIIGVAPRSIEELDSQVRFVIPLAPVEGISRYAFARRIYGRLKPGATIGAARAQVTALERKYYDVAPPFMRAAHDSAGLVIHVDSVQSQRALPARLKMYMLQGAVLFVLLIGCVNVANLLLARSNARQGELAIRVSLGAGRSQIARQLLVEAGLLTLFGVALGLAFACSALHVINRFTAQLLPTALPIAINTQVLEYTALIAFLTVCAIGIFPIFHVLGGSLFASMQHQSRSTSGSRSARRMSSALIVVQVATTLILLASTGLLVRSFANALAVDPGFQPGQLITAEIALPNGYLNSNGSIRFQQRLLDALHNIPGLTGVSLATAIPFKSPLGHSALWVEDHTARMSASQQDVCPVGTSLAYLDTMKIPLIEGRWFRTGDADKSHLVVVVNQGFANRYFQGASAVSRHVTFNPALNRGDWPEIVGVVGNVSDLHLEDSNSASPSYVYVPLAQYSFRNINLFVRSQLQIHDVSALLRKILKDIDPAIPAFRVDTMEDVISSSFGERRAILWLLGSFATIALILSAVGIYGTLAYDVSQRLREIGIREAIGATDKQVMLMVLRQGLWKVLFGLILGIIGAIQLTRFITSLLFEVKPTDPLALFAVSVLLLLVALLASYLPARRAARIDPIIVLRSE